MQQKLKSKNSTGPKKKSQAVLKENVDSQNFKVGASNGHLLNTIAEEVVKESKGDNINQS